MVILFCLLVMQIYSRLLHLKKIRGEGGWQGKFFTFSRYGIMCWTPPPLHIYRGYSISKSTDEGGWQKVFLDTPFTTFLYVCREVPESLNEQWKMIVFEQQLMELFQSCPKCAKPAAAHVVSRRGTQVTVKQHCLDLKCKTKRTWTNMPKSGQIPAGNLLLSASMLFNGVLPTKFLRVLEHTNILAMKPGAFFR